MSEKKEEKVKKLTPNTNVDILMNLIFHPNFIEYEIYL